MATLTRQVTADNFLEVANLPEYADRSIELVEGELCEMPVTNNDHSEIESRLSTLIGYYVMLHKLGRTYSGNAGVIVERNPDGRDTVRGLDFVFLSAEKAPRRLPPGLIEIAPDLVIEVISPSNTADDTRLKVRQLLQAGCAQVWIVYPKLREVDVHSSDGIKTYGESDTLAAPDILPGFEIAVADIFPA
ncbi:MAG: Uma2 family endonuclease [Chloroflexi bacterium]|nr:Uma2 family endonuclease [Chloroflexota bacterium]